MRILRPKSQRSALNQTDTSHRTGLGVQFHWSPAGGFAHINTLHVQSKWMTKPNDTWNQSKSLSFMSLQKTRIKSKNKLLFFLHTFTYIFFTPEMSRCNVSEAWWESNHWRFGVGTELPVLHLVVLRSRWGNCCLPPGAPWSPNRDARATFLFSWALASSLNLKRGSGTILRITVVCGGLEEQFQTDPFNCETSNGIK